MAAITYVFAIFQSQPSWKFQQHTTFVLLAALIASPSQIDSWWYRRLLSHFFFVGRVVIVDTRWLHVMVRVEWYMNKEEPIIVIHPDKRRRKIIGWKPDRQWRCWQYISFLASNCHATKQQRDAGQLVWLLGPHHCALLLICPPPPLTLLPEIRI